MQVNFYSSITDTSSQQIYNIESLLDMIKHGIYQDKVLQIRSEPSKAKRNELKKHMPNFTVCGIFSSRNAKNIVTASGLIAIDFDDLADIERSRALLQNDPYTYALFTSVSGFGLCCIVKIDPVRHADAFAGLQEYYWSAYQLTIDPACKDVSRTRYMSWDPDLFTNELSTQFKSYPKAKGRQQPITQHLHTDAKFNRVLQAIDKDITGNYEQWLSIAFAIASEYGQKGLNAFLHVSSFGPTYKVEDATRQYEACLRYGSKGTRINTFYYHAKQAGIDITSPREQYVSRLAYHGKQSGKSIEQVAEQVGDPSPDDEQTIAAVFQDETFKPEQRKGKSIDHEEVLIWLRNRYDLRRNALTRAYELGDKELETDQLNTIYLDAKREFDKLTRDHFETIIFSTHTPTHNPIKDYLDSLEWDGVDRLTDLAAVITSDTGTPQFRQNMLAKWLLGMVRTIYTGEPNILCLVLAGKRNTGKTQFFKRLLPAPLKRFFANSQLDKGKDDELLMTQKLIIFDDEYSGKSKQDSKHMKMMLSSDSFTLREPYGRKNITLPRLATLCGTCNETEILNDPTGNRRIVVIEATGNFSFELMNSIDKAMVLAQLVHMMRQGASNELTSEDIAELDAYTAIRYSEVSLEAEMIDAYFEPPSDYAYSFLTASQVKDWIELNSKQRLSLRRLGMELKRLGYQRQYRGNNYGYLIEKKPMLPTASSTPYNGGPDAPY